MNSHLENSLQNAHFGCRSTTSRIEAQKSKTAPTSQRTVRSKIKVSITKPQRDWVAYLFRQYDKPVPGWLRTSFVINQRRRKLLNDIFKEANVDGGYCGQCIYQDDWSYHTHCVWHVLNEIPICS